MSAMQLCRGTCCALVFYGRDKQVPGSLAARDEGSACVLEMGSDARELRFQCLERQEGGRASHGVRVSWAKRGGAHL